MHSDCCSKSCLSYLYKCVRRYGIHDEIQPTTIDTIDALVDRFASDGDGDGDGDGTPDPYQTHPNQIPTATFAMPTAQNALPMNEIDRDETNCRNNGISVQTFKL